MSRASVFAANLRVFAAQALSPAAQSAHLAQQARKARDDLIATGRASKKYRTFVDGREGAAEEAVQPAPNGRIVYRFNHLGAIVTFALSFLRARSPYGGRTFVTTAGQSTGKYGAYRDNFYVGIDGKFIMMQQFNSDALTANIKEIVIGNRNAYSRKVDVQFVGYEKLTFSFPPGLFNDAVLEIKRRFGTLVDVKRVYTMNFPGQYRLVNEQYHRSGARAGRPRGRAGKLVESPAIIITPKP